jgi:hypothetical protein
MSLPKNRIQELYALQKKFFASSSTVADSNWSTPEALDVSQSSRKVLGDIPVETLSGNPPGSRINWIYGEIQNNKALAII